MKVLIHTATVILALFVGGLLFLYVAPGYNLFMVRSGSMWPAISAGDLIITGPVDGPFNGEIKPSRIITYRRGETFITHRTMTINGDIIVTRGDAVQTNDSWIVHRSEVIGVYLFKIPQVGQYASFVADPRRWFLVIILPAGILLWLLFREIFKNRKAIGGRSDKK